jgi:epsilon-lactone hydrolase
VVERGDRMVLKQALRLPLPASRRVLHALRHMSPPPRDVSVGPRILGGVEGEVTVPPAADDSIRIVYLHGGGYRVGSTATQRGLVGHLAKAAGVRAFSVEYRLAPEHACPAALDDAVAAYAAVAGQTGDGVVLAGDSAGGALALAAALAARDRGLPAPTGLALISPWVDLAMTGASYSDNAKAEAVLTVDRLRYAAGDYRGALAADDAVCSPLYADLSGLPPMLVHSGSHDLLLSDCESLVARVRAAGGDAELRVFHRLWHDFHLHVGVLAAADQAVAELAAWIVSRLQAGAEPA